MATARLLLNAKAKKMGIANYRQMSLEDLEAAVKGTNGASASAKGKTAQVAKGKTTATPAKGKTTVSKPVTKGKTAVTKKTAPAKSTVRKPAPAKGKTAAKGTPAKRAVAPKPAAKKTTTRKTATHILRPKATIVKAGEGVKNLIDLKQIDWTNRETRIGTSGKRKIVLDCLRKKKNYVKVYEELQDQARKFYPGKTKAEAEALLKWLINRVAYDYVLVTGQHEPGKRQAYGARQTAKPATTRKAAPKAAAKPAARRGRPPGSTNKAKAASVTRKPAVKRTVARKAPVKKTTGRVVKGKR